uniref:B30.2/SPRY domain-containing protein n=1 Tax=Oncorhynchus mykiss TaxID=8022 RepID=A0A8K9VCK7_ONCMY
MCHCVNHNQHVGSLFSCHCVNHNQHVGSLFSCHCVNHNQHVGSLFSCHCVNHNQHVGSLFSCHCVNNNQHVGSLFSCHCVNHNQHVGSLFSCHCVNHNQHVGSLFSCHCVNHNQHVGSLFSCHCVNHNQHVGSLFRGQCSKMSLSGEREEGGPASKMSLSGEREEGGPASKMSLSGEHDTKTKSPIKQERPASPVPSCVSVKSNQSMCQPIQFRKGDFSTEQRGQFSKMSLSGERDEGDPASKMRLSGEREEGDPASKMRLSGEREGGPDTKAKRPIKQERPASPVPSCVSMKSDQSMEPPMKFREGDFSTEQRNQQERSESEILSGQSSQSHQTDLASIFSLLEEKIMTFVKNELKMFKGILSPELPEGFESQKQDKEVVDAEDEQQESSAREGALKITLHILRKMNQKELADTLEKYELAVICQRELKSNLKKKFQCVFEGIAKQGNPTFLNKIYTELYITEGGTGEVNNEHELRQIETTTRKQARPETAIKCNDIFKPLTGQDKPIRTVLTKGVAGIGKTVSVQKFILDWAEGKANQDVQFVFSFPFRELNLMKEDKHTFIELLNHFSMETKQSGISIYNKFKVLFIFDGLDECRLPLDFQKNKICWDVTESTSVDVLLTNLIKGNLLPSALLWITTRPAAANKIPSRCIDQVTEVRGFNDPQKEEYFRKRFSDEDLASRIISHIKTSRSLHIMCHIPVFCWISATVLEHMLKHKREEMPKTLTEMYTHLVEFHTKQKNEKYLGKEETGPHWNKESILSLGKLAFQQLVKGNLIFYEEDLKEAGIDVNEASVYSGLCTQLFKEECVLYQDKVYCFVHLSIQEFLAAVYVFLSFNNNNENLMDKLQTNDEPEVTFYKSAVDKALQSETGNLDLFLRFLLGLSLESNQKHLRGLLTKTRSSSQSHEETVKYIKEKIRENPSPERSINLFHCLNELNDHSLVEEIQSFLRSGSLSKPNLSPAQWSALVFVLLTSEKELDVFDLKKYSRSEEGLLRLLPVVKASRAVLLSGCLVTEEGCASLVSALRSNPSHLRELDLSYNHPGDSGVRLLSAGLEDPHCRLEKLNVEHGGEYTMKPGLRKYVCDLTLDPNTVYRLLSLSEENRKVTLRSEEQSYPDHPERFENYEQVLCREGLTGCCYWEVEWSGRRVDIGVTYKGISRKGRANDFCLGYNDTSWTLFCYDNSYIACHNNNPIAIDVRPSSFHKVGVYLDWPAGTLSFYRVSSDTLTHLYTFTSTFTEPLYPGFRVWYEDSSVSLCQTQHGVSL